MFEAARGKGKRWEEHADGTDVMDCCCRELSERQRDLPLSIDCRVEAQKMLLQEVGECLREVHASIQ